MGILRWIMIGGLTILAVTGAGALLALHGQATGWLVTKRSLSTWVEAIEGHTEVIRPPGAGPFPVFAIFPGCGGVRPHHAQWARLAADEGYLALIVDSFGLRGLDRAQSLRDVCSGTRLWGRERAGDVAAALALVRRREDTDPERIVLMGQSHGAWSIMDLMAMDLEDRRPTSLSQPLDPSIRRGVIGTVLFYPYCGLFSLSGSEGWGHTPPTLMFVPMEDQVVSALACLETAGALEETGLSLDLVTFPDADHAFDEFALGTDEGSPYRQDLTEQARATVAGFLRRVGSSGP
ncbi:MAG: dienelactone hydrolase family protein [Alphaproteobacteria bacterium]